MQDFRELRVWQRSHQLTIAIYRATASFPKEEMFGLTRQIRRAAASIGANIAEGCGRDSGADFARFLQIAAGSASEVDNHLLLAKDLGFLTNPQLEPLASELAQIRPMLTSLIQKVRGQQPKT